MSKRNVILASVALTACLCWALGTSIAEQQSQPPSQPSGQAAVNPGSDAAQSDAVDFAVIPGNDSGPVLIRMADPSRVREIENPVYEPDPELDVRTPIPCTNIAYRNGPSSQISVFLFGGFPPNDNAGDDCRLPPGAQAKFICAAKVVTMGFILGGPPTYNLKVQVWNECAEDPGALLVGQGTFLNIPNDKVQRTQTITVDPPYFDSDDVLWVFVQSDNPDAAWEIARNTTEPSDVGSTLDLFPVLNGVGDCGDNYFFFGGNPYAGFSTTLLGSLGPAGSCCAIDAGSCVDGVLLRDCADFLTQSWSTQPCSSRLDCVACNIPACPPGTNPPNRENEPDCFTNYVDTTNRGCHNLTIDAASPWWTPITFGQTGCGRSGTYTYLNNFVDGTGTPRSIEENRRDDDHYQISLTQDTRVTWTVKAKFPSLAQISFTLRQTNGLGTTVNCPNSSSTSFGAQNNVAPGDIPFDTANPCEDAVVTACLPGRNTAEGPFRYFLRALPSLTRLSETQALCGLAYTYEVAPFEACTLPTGACCTQTGCVQVSRFACMLLTSRTIDVVDQFYKGDGTNCIDYTCPGVPANDACVNYINLTCTSCVLDFDTTFGSTGDRAYGAAPGLRPYKDIWYRYTIPAVEGCASGRLVLSTIGSCFNMRGQLIKIGNCNATASVQCGTTAQGTPNANIRGNLTPMALQAGPPLVNVGPWLYGSNNDPAAIAGECYMVRVGGLLTESDFGLGKVRIDFVCKAPTNPAVYHWGTSTGRCCIWDGATNACSVTPLGSSSNPQDTNPQCCARLGGYHRINTDFTEGATPAGLASVETSAVACSVLPCPNQGEACYNAWDLNTLLGGGSGTVTRLTRNRMYFKYVVPTNAAVGSGIHMNLCNSSRDPTRPGVFFFDTAMGVWRGFNLTTGECDGTSTVAFGGSDAAQACLGTEYDGREVIRANDCNSTDPRADGAFGISPCYRAGELNSCLCLKVVASNPGLGQVAPGGTIYIGAGLKYDLPSSFARPFMDITRSDDCTTDRIIQLQVTNPAACFTCGIACPPSATPEGETIPTPSCQDYVDHVNAGCSTDVPADVLFLPITCGQTYCGTSALYRTNKPCQFTSDCDLGDSCNQSTLHCEGPDINSRDSDWYKLTLTQPTRLTWTVTAAFAATAQIIVSPTDNCNDQTVVANTINVAQCASTVATADICGPTTVYLVVRPSVEDIGDPVCSGMLYYANLQCSTPSISVSGCCKGDMNNDGKVNGLDIDPWLDQALPTTSVPRSGRPQTFMDKIRGCFDVRTCRADLNNDYKVDMSDLSGFVAALLAGTPCPSPTLCDDTAACHRTSADDSGVVSDLSVSTFGGGYRSADDFKVVAGTTLDKVCWYGFYFNFNVVDGCTPAGGDSADNFTITIYDTVVSGNTRLPGKPLGIFPILNANIAKTAVGGALSYLARFPTRYKYECNLPSSVSVTPGTCYWMEIVNNTTGQCLWLWETSASMGNKYGVQKNGGPAGRANWYEFDQAADDFAWCLPGLRVDNVDCGLPVGQCCIYPGGAGNGTCVAPPDRNKPDCEVLLGGRWFPGTCPSPCPFIPPNDNCASAILITTGPVYTGTTNFMTVDGPPMSCEQSCGSACNAAADVWYKWVAGVLPNVTFTMCEPYIDPANYPPTTYLYDAMMLIYDGCPAAGGLQMPGGCNDDGCEVSSTTSKITSVTVTQSTTYWIRISGWSGTVGNFTLKVTQP